jgi:signal transduction histidine kinase
VVGAGQRAHIIGQVADMPPRVLFIQDDDALRRRVRELLEARGFAVETTGSGLDGIVRALRNRPDVVLTDVHLSDIEGAELAARLRRESALSGVPIVGMGGSVDERGAILAAGADGFVARAVDGALPDRLLEIVEGEREKLSPERELEELRKLVGTMSMRLESALGGQRRAVGKLVETDRLKSVFIHNLAHELSTPLTPLAGYLRILQAERTGSVSEQQKRILDSMATSVGRLTRILDNLADFASLEMGHAPLVESRVEPDRLAEEVAAEQRAPVREARLHLQIHPSGGAPVLADARKLRQALSNLVSNAVKFSQHGGEVLIEVSREPGRLRYTVYDQGPGIPAEEQERIFEPMHHAAARSGEEARPPGSGLGLPVVRRIAEAHGGRVSVESPPRTQPLVEVPHQYTGSKFVLEVAVRPADQPGAAAPSAVTG